MNEFNEGDYFDDFMLPTDGLNEKQTARELFNRLEKKMPIMQGVDMADHKPLKPFVYQEFPRVLFHRKMGTRVVNNTQEKEALLKEGWELSPAKIKREEELLRLIPELEKQLADSIVEFEKLTGKDYENELVKMQRKDK